MDNLWQKILSSYTPEKRRWDGQYPYFRWILRPLSFPLTWLAFKVGLSANQVTLLSVLALVPGAVLLGTGDLKKQLLGAALVVVFNLLDSVDGNLARLKPPDPTSSGAFIDGMAIYPYLILFIALGIGIGRSPSLYDSMLAGYWGVSKKNAIFIFFAFLGFAATLSRFMEAHLGLIYMKWKRNLPRPGADSPDADAGKDNKSIWRVLWMNVTDLTTHDILLLPILFFGLGGWYLFLAALGGVFSFVLRLSVYISRAIRA